MLDYFVSHLILKFHVTIILKLLYENLGKVVIMIITGKDTKATENKEESGNIKQFFFTIIFEVTL